MAQQFQTSDTTLTVPGAYGKWTVASSASGTSTSGVITLIGEADGGPDYTLETSLKDNAFSPSDVADVQAKYISGPIVDAMRNLTAPSADDDIQGAPSLVRIVKTNPSTKASNTLPKIGGGTYGTLYDQGYGLNGNLIYFQTAAATAEVRPTTGAFTYIPAVGTVALDLRISGNAAVAPATLAANTTPAAFVTAVGALTGVSCTGGAARTTIVASTGTLAVGSISGNSAVITYSTNFTTTPSVGDTVVIPSTSVIAGAGSANVGAYVVTAATSTTISVTKLSDAGKGGAVIGTITAPVAVSAVAVSATVANDLVDYGPVTITSATSTVIDGVGKSLEVNQLTTGTDLLSRTAYVLGTTTPVTWISKTGAPALLVSATEYSVTLTTNRQMDAVSESITAGGQIALKLGYTGTTASVVVSPTTMVFTLVGGAGAGLSPITLTLKNYPTIADLVNYINTLPGFTAAVGSNVIGQMSPLGLDEGTFNLASDFGNQTLRLKVDAAKFWAAISGNSVLVQLGNPTAPVAAGLPDVMAAPLTLLNGARGATTDAVFNAAMDAVKLLDTNFVVPLLSRDATGDIADGITASGSSYTIANVNAYSKTHVLAVSTRKLRRFRQAFLSIRDTFANAKSAAAGLATHRCALAFQDCKTTGANGTVQFQPWMTAVLAAGMQAAGFYKAIFNKEINAQGFVQAAGDFNDQDETGQLTDALDAGLLPVHLTQDGVWAFASDQTTYSKDNDAVLNSIQAVYDADLVLRTVQQRMEKAFVGKSTADVTATLGLAALEHILDDLFGLKLLAASPDDGADKGYRNLQVRIKNGAMPVTGEVKVAGAIYFIPIDFTVSLPVSSASA